MLVQTVVAAYFASRNRRAAAAWRWRRRMEPVHLDLLDWASSVQIWAAAKGLRGQLPPIPPTLAAYLDQEVEDGDLDLLGHRHE